MVNCAYCKKEIAERDIDAEDLDAVSSENLGGMICKECQNELYYCSRCEDYDTESSISHGEAVCSSCKRCDELEDSQRKEFSYFLRGLL